MPTLKVQQGESDERSVLVFFEFIFKIIFLFMSRSHSVEFLSSLSKSALQVLFLSSSSKLKAILYGDRSRNVFYLRKCDFKL